MQFNYTDSETDAARTSRSGKEDPICNGIAPVDADSDIYNMNKEKIGICLIFIQETFDVHTGLEPRGGSNVDEESLISCFQSLGFQIIIHRNLSYDVIKEKLKNAAEEDHTNCACFVCIMLTHGKEGNVYASDKNFCVEKLFLPFVGHKCVTLAGKPKIFFIEACQGKRSSDGVTLQGPQVESDGSKFYTIPSHADFLLSCAAAPGLQAWRSTITGSVFVSTLCSLLLLHYKEKDLVEILTLVNREIAVKFKVNKPEEPKNHEKKQIPSFTSMLTRKMYFIKHQ